MSLQDVDHSSGDLWLFNELEGGPQEAGAQENEKTAVRIEIADVAANLASSTSPEDYYSRKAVALPQIETACARVASGAHFASLVNAVIQEFDRDFEVVHNARTAGGLGELAGEAVGEALGEGSNEEDSPGLFETPRTANIDHSAASSYAGDPHWMTARYPGKCDAAGCSDPIKKGDKIFYYPSSKKAYVGTHAEANARDFSSAAQDEDTYHNASLRTASEEDAMNVLKMQQHLHREHNILPQAGVNPYDTHSHAHQVGQNEHSHGPDSPGQEGNNNGPIVPHFKSNGPGLFETPGVDAPETYYNPFGPYGANPKTEPMGGSPAASRPPTEAVRHVGHYEIDQFGFIQRAANTRKVVVDEWGGLTSVAAYDRAADPQIDRPDAHDEDQESGDPGGDHWDSDYSEPDDGPSRSPQYAWDDPEHPDYDRNRRLVPAARNGPGSAMQRNPKNVQPGTWKATHKYDPIGWDKYDPRPHKKGGQPIEDGAEVQAHGYMSPKGAIRLVHISDEAGTHQTVDQRSLKPLHRRSPMGVSPASGLAGREGAVQEPRRGLFSRILHRLSAEEKGDKDTEQCPICHRDIEKADMEEHLERVHHESEGEADKTAPGAARPGNSKAKPSAGKGHHEAPPKHGTREAAITIPQRDLQFAYPGVYSYVDSGPWVVHPGANGSSTYTASATNWRLADLTGNSDVPPDPESDTGASGQEDSGQLDASGNFGMQDAPQTLQDANNDANSTTASLNYKIAQIAANVLTSNPGLSEDEAIRLAQRTIRLYPKVAYGGADYLPFGEETLTMCPQCGKAAFSEEARHCHSCGFYDAGDPTLSPSTGG